MIVHLLEYQVLPGHAAEVEGFVRESLSASARGGLLARCAGRRLAVDGPRHIVLSAWRDADVFRIGTNSAGMPRDLASRASLIRRRLPSQFRAVEWHGLNWCDARVLRLYRASVARDGLEAWERSVPGELHEIIGKPGSVAALAGVAILDEEDPSDVQIMVLSAWRDWDSLLGATGGRLNRPILGTENAGPQPPSLADHYELIDIESNSSG